MLNLPSCYLSLAVNILKCPARVFAEAYAFVRALISARAGRASRETRLAAAQNCNYSIASNRTTYQTVIHKSKTSRGMLALGQQLMALTQKTKQKSCIMPKQNYTTPLRRLVSFLARHHT